MNSRLMIALLLSILVPTRSPAADVFGGTRKAVDLGEYQGFVLEPPKPGPEGSRPWVWYAPVLGTNPSPNTAWMFRQLIDSGFYIVGVNVGESQGNPAGRKGYSLFYNQVVREFKLEPKARMLGQSRGGLMVYNWAAENPDKVQCIAGIYPACDLRSYPKLPNAAKAYGLSLAEMEESLPQHNPIDRLEPLARAKIPILHVHGDADRAVPIDKNSQALHDRYRALGGPVKLIVVPGKGHEAIPEYFEEPRMVEFLKVGGFPDGRDRK
jgi:dipeptidyl aminopeptidase/acylaminoacyl peptidase